MEGVDCGLPYFLIAKLLTIPGIVFVLSWKGFSQAWMAKKLGDPTPESAGKLTLNPLAHIDLFGFLFLLLIGIGWGKPVPTNSRYYKHVRRDCAIQILSGPVGCVLGGFLMSLLYTVCYIFLPENTVTFYITSIFWYAASISITLAIFYLLPLPGLDGYNLIANFLPYKYYNKLYAIEKYSTLIFIAFILLLDYTPLGSILITGPASAISYGFESFWFWLCTLFL